MSLRQGSGPLSPRIWPLSGLAIADLAALLRIRPISTTYSSAINQHALIGVSRGEASIGFYPIRRAFHLDGRPRATGLDSCTKCPQTGFSEIIKKPARLPDRAEEAAELFHRLWVVRHASGAKPTVGKKTHLGFVSRVSHSLAVNRLPWMTTPGRIAIASGTALVETVQPLFINRLR